MTTDTQAPVDVLLPPVAPAKPAAAKRGLYHRFRSYMHRTPWLFHTLRAIRFTAMVGPWRPVLIKFHQTFTRNAVIRVNERTLFPEFDPRKAADDVARDGYAVGLALPDEYVNRLIEHFRLPRIINITNPHLQCSTANEIAHDPKLIEAARRYLGAEPVFFGTELWSNVPAAGRQHGHRFHFDVSDVRSMTVFFFLTDVNENGGAHIAIAGTHKRKTLMQCLRLYLSDRAAQRQYGARMTTMFGPKGTGFCEELTIFHKVGFSDQYRLMFSICYTLRRKPTHAVAS